MRRHEKLTVRSVWTREKQGRWQATRVMPKESATPTASAPPPKLPSSSSRLRENLRETSIDVPIDRGPVLIKKNNTQKRANQQKSPSSKRMNSTRTKSEIIEPSDVQSANDARVHKDASDAAGRRRFDATTSESCPRRIESKEPWNRKTHGGDRSLRRRDYRRPEARNDAESPAIGGSVATEEANERGAIICTRILPMDWRSWCLQPADAIFSFSVFFFLFYYALYSAILLARLLLFYLGQGKKKWNYAKTAVKAKKIIRYNSSGSPSHQTFF